MADPLPRHSSVSFQAIAGIDSINSSNSQGQTSVTLQFNLSRNIDAAAQDVQTAISAALPQLPPGLPAPRVYKGQPATVPYSFYLLTRRCCSYRLSMNMPKL